MTSELALIKISTIDSNPLRQLDKYPFNEHKLDALGRSIEDVGLWEGVIARRHGNRVQLAFGHHRIEAARHSKRYGEDGKIPVIVRDLTDEEMLQFMGRENLEDYNADFPVMLETWEAAIAYKTSRAPAVKYEDIEIARLLGWTRLDTNSKSGHRSNDTAQACSDAARLIAGDYLNRTDLRNLTVDSVVRLCGRIVAQHEALERMAVKTKRPASEIEQGKKAVGKAGTRVARDVRSGKVAPRDIRSKVDVEAYRFAKGAKRQSPLFAAFGKALADSIGKVAKDDSIAEKCTEIKKALGKIETDDDIHIVKRLAFECEGASRRFDKWATTFADPKKKVVKLKQIK